MSSNVFKIGRKSVSFDIELSSGKKVNLTLLSPNTKQQKEILKNSDTLNTKEIIKLNEKIFFENLRGKESDIEEFKKDIELNGNLYELIRFSDELFDKELSKKKLT